MTGDGNRHTADRIDGEHARCQRDGVVVGNIIRSTHNLVSAGERAGVCSSIRALGNIADCPSVAADEVVGGNARDGLLRAVVGERVRLARQGHRTLGNGDSALVGRDVGVVITVLDDIVIRIGNACGVVGDTGRCCDGQRVAGGQLEDGAVTRDVRHSRAVICHHVAREGVLRTVILPSLGVRLDDQRTVVAGHLQGAVTRLNVVVSGLGVGIQYIDEGVGTAAHARLAAGECVGGTLASHKARLLSQRRGAVHQRDTVVSLRQVGRLERDRTLGDAQGEGGIHAVVVRARGAGNHVQRAEVRDRRDIGGEGAAAVNAVGHRRSAGAVYRAGAARATQRSSVILLLKLARQRDDQGIAGGNRQLAVRHVERHRAEVRIVVRELRGGELHVRGTHIGTSRCGIAAVGEVGHVVERIGDVHVVAAHALLGAVIDLRGRMAGDGHCHVDRVDGLVAVRHVECHRGEVRVVVDEHRTRKTHLGLAVGIGTLHHIGSGCLSRSVEGEVGFVVQRTADARHRVAAHAMLTTIVRRCILSSHDGHRRIDRGDGLVAVRHVERHRAEVRVGVGELSGSEAHVRGAGIRAFRRNHTALQSGTNRRREREVTTCIQRSAVRGVEARHRMLGAVISRCIGVALDRHRRIDWRDGLITIRHMEDNGSEVRVHVGEHRIGETHISLAVCIGAFHHIGSRGFSRAAEGEVGSRVKRVADFDFVAGDCMRGSVIVGGIVMAGDGHHHLFRRSDSLVAVRHIEGHLVEIRRIRVGELSGSEAHVRGAHHSTLRRNHTAHQCGIGGGCEGEVTSRV